jgi:hypothetical protein
LCKDHVSRARQGGRSKAENGALLEVSP